MKTLSATGLLGSLPGLTASATVVAMKDRRGEARDGSSAEPAGPCPAPAADGPGLSNRQVAKLAAGPAGLSAAVLGVAGNNAVRGLLQPKLEVGASGSPLEREADRVAAEVVDGGSAAGPDTRGRAPLAVSPAGGPDDAGQPAPPAVDRALSGAGSPLADGVRGRFESGMRQDFADVRVHTESPAPAAVGAAAFTVGSDIVFAPGRYAPEQASGQRLLAHELTHVVQQRGAGAAPVQRSEEDAPPPVPSTGAVPVLFGFDDVGRRIYASVTVPGHTVADISTYVYGTPDKVVELQDANGVRDTVPPGRNLTLVAGTLSAEAQRVVNQGLKDGTILRSKGIPPGESGTGPVTIYRFAAGEQQFEVTEGQLRGMAQGQATWVTRQATRLRDYAESGRDVHADHLEETNGAVRWVADWMADQDELSVSVWNDALTKAGDIVDALATFDATSGEVTDLVALVGAQANKLPEAAEALDTAEQAWRKYIEGTISGAEVAVHRLEIVRNTSFVFAAGLAGAAAAPVVFAAAGAGLATVGVTGTTATVLSGTAAVGAGAVAGGTTNTALNLVAPSSIDKRPVDEQIKSNFASGALAGGLGAVGSLAAPGVSGAISQKTFGVAPEALGLGARTAVGTATGVVLGTPLGAVGAGVENVAALARGEISTEEYLRRIGWGALVGGITGAITGFLGSAFAKPGPAGGGGRAVDPDVVYQPPQVDPKTGVVSQMALHLPSGQYVRATYNPATGTGEIVNLSTGQQVAVVRNGVVSPPAKALAPPGETAVPQSGTAGVAGEPVAVPGQVGGAGGALPAVVVPSQPAALPPGGQLIGPPVPALPGVPERPALPADPAVEAQLAEATAKLNKALVDNGLPGDPIFANLDILTAGKVTTALSQWPRAIPTPLRARMLEWGRAGCGGSPREFANRVEYARARFGELVTRFDAEFAAATPKPKDVGTAARKAAVAAMDSEAGMNDLSVILANELATISAANRSGSVPLDLPAGQVPDAVRNLPNLPYESGTAEAYHAHKHMEELPPAEQNWNDPINAYAASMQETVRSGSVVLDKMAGTSRKLVYQREVDGTVVEAIVYVQSDGSVVVASYGAVKAVKGKKK